MHEQDRIPDRLAPSRKLLIKILMVVAWLVADDEDARAAVKRLSTDISVNY